MKSLALDETLWTIDPGADCPGTVLMVVEVPKNSSNKYEYDPDVGLFKLDRALYSPVHFPGDYGFIPGTIAEDGQPIDVLTLVERPSFPGCVFRVRPIGVLHMTEDSKHDHKILAVPERSPRYEEIRGLGDVPPHVLTEIQHFFEIYQDLEGKTGEIKDWHDINSAHSTITESRGCYLTLREARSRVR